MSLGFLLGLLQIDSSSARAAGATPWGESARASEANLSDCRSE